MARRRQKRIGRLTAGSYDRLSRRAGVDSDRRTGNIAPTVAEQEFHGSCDVFGFWKPAQRASARNLLPLIVIKPFCHSVSMKPGAMAFTVTPTLPTSRDSERVNPMMADLLRHRRKGHYIR